MLFMQRGLSAALHIFTDLRFKQASRTLCNGHVRNFCLAIAAALLPEQAVSQLPTAACHTQSTGGKPHIRGAFFFAMQKHSKIGHVPSPTARP